MATIKGVERSVQQVEGFAVHFTYAYDGSDVRGDERDLPSYKYARAAPDEWTVAEWRAKRFRQRYPSYIVTVLDGSGKPAHGRTTLSNLRATYLER